VLEAGRPFAPETALPNLIRSHLIHQFCLYRLARREVKTTLPRAPVAIMPGPRIPGVGAGRGEVPAGQVLAREGFPMHPGDYPAG